MELALLQETLGNDTTWATHSDIGSIGGDSCGHSEAGGKLKWVG